MVSESERYVGRGGVEGVKLDMVSHLAPQANVVYVTTGG